MRVGRAMAVAAILSAIYGVVTLVVIGRSDHLSRGGAMFVLFTVGFGALAWLAIPRQPDNNAVWVPAWAALLVGVSSAGWATAILIGDLAGLDVSSAGMQRLSPSEVPLGAAIGWELVNVGAVVGFFLMLTLWLLLFPDGELPSPRWRWISRGAVTTMLAVTALLVWVARPGSTIEYGTPSTEYTGIGSLVDPLYLLLLTFSGVCVGSLVARYRRSTGEDRRRYRWIGLGTAALYFAVFVVDESAWQLLAALLGVAISVVCYGVAVTRYRLYGIDLVISRTLVYGTLAAFIGAVYVLVVVGVGGMLSSEVGDLTLAVAATAVVAIAFEPVRRRAQRWANRLVYGKRATPYEVLSNLTRRLAGAEPAQGLLERMAQLTAEGTGAEQATVWLADPDERLEAAAGWPQMPKSGEAKSMDQLSGFTYPVLHDDQLVGVLEVIKGRSDPVTPTERRLIIDLAGSAGMVLGNQRLNTTLAARATELQESRRRLVDLQDSERRHLERDLHDGAQQQVVALKLKIGLARHVAMRQGAGGLADELGELAEEAQAAVDDIRRLAKGIYPPLLESENLAVAIKSQAASMPIPVDVLGEGIERYPRDVESAMYFAALEAMANAVKHAAPSHVHVTLGTSEEMLGLEVTDDGAGFDPEGPHEGTGLINIRDRVEALGGELDVHSTRGRGSTVSVRIPLGDVVSRDVEQSPESHLVVGRSV
ncbi:MAG TPA: ATP-binding protein [Acidimicrobiia bacterium]